MQWGAIAGANGNGCGDPASARIVRARLQFIVADCRISIPFSVKSRRNSARLIIA
jgi:hypothetical protein